MSSNDSCQSVVKSDVSWISVNRNVSQAQIFGSKALAEVCQAYFIKTLMLVASDIVHVVVDDHKCVSCPATPHTWVEYEGASKLSRPCNRSKQAEGDVR